MTLTSNIIARIEKLGGELSVRGERIRCRLPEDATHLLDELRKHREEAIFLLGQRRDMPAMPAGVRLLSWHLEQAPIRIDACSLVTDSYAFARTTLEQLRATLASPKRWVGWSVPQLIVRLEQVGVIVKLEDDPSLCANSP
jgi:hypothetical protein